MRPRITLRIQGSGGETDAPTVEDFLGQLRDFFEILKAVEEAVSSDAKSVIDWRIVAASMNSSIRIEAEAFPKEFGVNIDRRVSAVVRNVVEGLTQLSVRDDRPPHFTDAILQRAEGFFHRVTNGLANTIIDCGEGELSFEVNRELARSAEMRAVRLLYPIPKAYRELGSVEGYFKSVERDGHNRPLIWIRHRITGADIKCIIADEALKERIAAAQIGEVWSRRRLLVTGMVHFKAIGKIDFVDADDIRLLRQRYELPSLDEILDETFTSGMRTEDYLEKLRNGEIR